MKKKIVKRVAICLTLVISAVLALGLGGCTSEKYDVVPEALTGIWSCKEEASDGETYTGFYALYINDDGTFSLYDTCGNPGISGILGAEEEGESGIVHISCDGEDFDPPACWDLEKEDELQYEKLDNGQMRLGHNDVWLGFYDEYTHEQFQFQLSNASYPEYEWKMERKGQGIVKCDMDRVEDEDVGFWSIYKFTGVDPGHLVVTMKYTNGKKVMYTVSFDLTVNPDRSIRENSREGDIDEAMTS